VNNNLRLDMHICVHCSRCCLYAVQQLVSRTICLCSCWRMKCGQVMADVHREGPIPKIEIPISWNLSNIRKYSVWSQAFYFFRIYCNFESKTYWALHLVEWQIDTGISEKLIASFFMIHQPEFYNLCTFYQENIIITLMFIIAEKKQNRIHLQDKYSWYVI
jgi:hypothetical protein